MDCTTCFCKTCFGNALNPEQWVVLIQNMPPRPNLPGTNMFGKFGPMPNRFLTNTSWIGGSLLCAHFRSNNIIVLQKPMLETATGNSWNKRKQLTKLQKFSKFGRINMSFWTPQIHKATTQATWRPGQMLLPAPLPREVVRRSGPQPCSWCFTVIFFFSGKWVTAWDYARSLRQMGLKSVFLVETITGC